MIFLLVSLQHLGGKFCIHLKISQQNAHWRIEYNLGKSVLKIIFITVVISISVAALGNDSPLKLLSH